MISAFVKLPAHRAGLAERAGHEDERGRMAIFSFPSTAALMARFATAIAVVESIPPLERITAFLFFSVTDTSDRHDPDSSGLRFSASIPAMAARRSAIFSVHTNR